MAWQEWEQLKAEAAQRAETHTQLNEAGAGTGAGDLVAHQDDLGAVGHQAFRLYDQLHRKVDLAGAGADKHGSGSTAQAATALKSHHFGMGGALLTTLDVWTSQVKSVLQACAHISNHLDYSKKRHAEDDARIAALVRGRDGSALPVSSLNQYFT